MKKFIILMLIAGLLNGCMVKRIFNGGVKGQGGGHKNSATMRR